MIQPALMALRQSFSAPFRSILLKSVGLALLLLIVLGIGLQALAASLIEFSNPNYSFIAELLTGAGILIGLVFLVPPVVALVAGLFQDQVAERVEDRHYPADPPGRELPAATSLLLAIRFALLALVVNLGALLLLLVPGVNIIIWWVANGYLLGREYFEFAAMRFRSIPEARALRRQYGGRVFLAGLLIAAFMAIPILNLATPIVASAFMVHIYKRLPNRRALPLPADGQEDAGRP